MPTRTRATSHPNPRYFSVDNISIEAALQESPDLASVAINDELQQMVDKGVFVPIEPSSVKTLGRIIGCKMFLKKKLNSEGQLTKWKGRLVAGGHQEIRTVFTDSSSPTAHISTVFTLATIAARQHRVVRTCDIKGAYLHAKMKKDVFMRLGKRLSSMLSDNHPTFRQYQDPSGNITVKLDRALYGCVESGKLWYLDISNFLTTLGFKMSAHDECLFTKMVNGRMIHVVIFVDDFLMTASQGADLDSLEDSLRTKYKEITVTEGLVHDYLGMKFDFSTDGKVIISMPNYVQKVIEVSGLTSHSTTPANKNLFVNLSHSLLPQDEQDDMHSLIAKLLYLSTRCRPDIALAVNYLCSRVKNKNGVISRGALLGVMVLVVGVY
jgi:hypothetical protein